MPPPQTPLTELLVAPAPYLAVVKFPKSIALPCEAIVIVSIILVLPGTAPPPKVALVEEDELVEGVMNYLLGQNGVK